MAPDTADPETQPDVKSETPPQPKAEQPGAGKPAPREHGGPKGRDPTRYQDWERGGRCIDF